MPPPSTPPASPETVKILQVLTDAERVRQSGGDMEAYLRKEVRYLTVAELDALRKQLTQPPTNPSVQLPETFRQPTADRQKLLEITQRELEALALAHKEGSIISPNDGSILPDIGLKRNPIFWSGKRWKDEARWGFHRGVDLATENPGLTVTAVVGTAALLYGLNKLRKKMFGPRTPAAPGTTPAPGPAPAPAPAPGPNPNEGLLKKTLLFVPRLVYGAFKRALSNALTIGIVGGTVAVTAWIFRKPITKFIYDQMRDLMVMGAIDKMLPLAKNALDSAVNDVKILDATTGNPLRLATITANLIPPLLLIDSASGDPKVLEKLLTDNGFSGSPLAREILGTDGTKFTMKFDTSARKFMIEKETLPGAAPSAYNETIPGIFVAHEADLAGMSYVEADVKMALANSDVKALTVDQILSLDSATIAANPKLAALSPQQQAALMTVKEIVQKEKIQFFFGRMTDAAVRALTLEQMFDETGMFLRHTVRLKEEFAKKGRRTSNPAELKAAMHDVFSPANWNVEMLSPRVRSHITSLGIAGKEDAFVRWIQANADQSLASPPAITGPDAAAFNAAIGKLRSEIASREADLKNLASTIADPTLRANAETYIAAALANLNLNDALQLSTYLNEAKNASGALVVKMGTCLLQHKIVEIVSRRNEASAKDLYAAIVASGGSMYVI